MPKYIKKIGVGKTARYFYNETQTKNKHSNKDEKNHSILNREISKNSNNIRGFYKEPSNWDNKERLTWKELIDNNIIDGKDLKIKNKLNKYYIELDGKHLRNIPKSVYDYYQKTKK